jgi:hypothetical protein
MAELLGTDADEDDFCPTCLEVNTDGEWLAGLQRHFLVATFKCKVGFAAMAELLGTDADEDDFCPTCLEVNTDGEQSSGLFAAKVARPM